MRIESAKQVSGEQRGFHFLDSVGPALPDLVERKKALISLTLELLADPGFLPRPNLQGEPGKLHSPLRKRAGEFRFGLRFHFGYARSEGSSTLPPQEPH